jgi:enoyl-CoA hydratase/carnithine racemase
VSFLYLEYSVHQKLFEAWALKSLPVVAVADGIVMGAGAGLWMASSMRSVP